MEQKFSNLCDDEIDKKMIIVDLVNLTKCF